MKKIMKWSGLALLLLLAVVLSVIRSRRVTDEYKLAVMPVHMETPITMDGYAVQSNRAEVYTLERYYEKYPQVADFEEMDKENYQYVLVVWMQITKKKRMHSRLIC